ncbi:MAG: DUF350 domain-containing protein [Bdellovibrionales bacterium]|nr:DUF350 domain-containing protein [Bdellovibrionales bacterium]
MEALGLKSLIAALVYSVVGLVALGVGFYVFDKITPGSLWHEIRQEKNIAVAIVVGSMAMAIAQIIASAVHG